jgi:hypothetical protein
MESIISLTAGSLFKLVDEIEDTDTKLFEGYKEYIQTLCTAFISLWLYNNAYISLIHILIILPLCLYVNQVDTLYWKTLLPLPFITFLLNAHTLANVDIYEIFQVSIAFILTMLYIILESYMFPEETSTSKMITRIGLVLVFSLLLFLITTNMKNEGFVNFSKSLLLFGIGYLCLSVISKVFFSEEVENLPISTEVRLMGN